MQDAGGRRGLVLCCAVFCSTDVLLVFSAAVFAAV